MFESKVDPAVARIAYDIHHACMREIGLKAQLDAFIWLAMTRPAGLKAELRPQLETELLRVAELVGLLAVPPRGDRRPDVLDVRKSRTRRYLGLA